MFGDLVIVLQQAMVNHHGQADGSQTLENKRKSLKVAKSKDKNGGKDGGGDGGKNDCEDVAEDGGLGGGEGDKNGGDDSGEYGGNGGVVNDGDYDGDEGGGEGDGVGEGSDRAQCVMTKVMSLQHLEEKRPHIQSLMYNILIGKTPGIVTSMFKHAYKGVLEPTIFNFLKDFGSDLLDFDDLGFNF